MNVLMVRAKIKEENVAGARAAIEKVIQALEQAQPAGIQYASCLLSDGVTFLALLKLEDDGGHPLRDLPAYAEMVENLKQWYDGPPAVDRMTVTGSYGLFCALGAVAWPAALAAAGHAEGGNGSGAARFRSGLSAECDHQLLSFALCCA